LIDTLVDLINRFQQPWIKGAGVIPWSCPVPSFGDICTSTVATLGLNPSNREFVDHLGNELDGKHRRLHTLRSLRLKQWADVKGDHLEQIISSCRSYFSINPYLRWFADLEQMLTGASASYHARPATACHLDLIPYATTCKWTELTSKQRGTLLDKAGDALGALLRVSGIQLLVLNGMTVIRNLEQLAGVQFEEQRMKVWTLPRRSGRGVVGRAFCGTIHEVAGVRLSHTVRVLGYNHNVQSSFGVTNSVKMAITRWIGRKARELLYQSEGQTTWSAARRGTSFLPHQCRRAARHTASRKRGGIH
jgi:hypothetical protein